ncbi:MAG: aminotransferase class V-fold PLP-dependent enzyme [Candidatus Krumholzibacteriia bacterium]
MNPEDRSTKTLDLRAIRSEFPILERITYFNTAANGLIPERGRRVLERFFSEHHYLEGISPYGLFEVLADTRAEAARLLSCEPEAIALTFNTSHGLNLAANSIEYEPGDNVVLARGEFPANVYPWRNLESRGVELRMVEVPGNRAEVESLAAACDARTRVVAISLLQFHDGYRPDLEALAAFCRDRGIYTVVDGIQGVGSCDVRPSRIGLDFLATGGQKWLLAPRGTGFLYVRRELIERLRLPILGWLNVDYGGRFDRLLRYPRELYTDARRFELGTANLHDILALRESLKLLNGVGIAAIEAHNTELAWHLREGLSGVRGLELCAAGRRASPIVAVGGGESAGTQALRAALADARVYFALREGRFRFAVHLYNSKSDVDRLVDTVRRTLG